MREAVGAMPWAVDHFEKKPGAVLARERLGVRRISQTADIKSETKVIHKKFGRQKRN